MSFKYGLNGNDINWDFLETANNKCTNCKQGENDYCEGHTIKYSKRGWSLFHDTNGNFVSFLGRLPLEVYNDDYLNEWFNDIYTNEKDLVRIYKELKERDKIPKVIGCWSIANTASLNAYLLQESNVDYIAFVGINSEIPKLLKVSVETDNEDARHYISYGRTKFYIDECLKIH
jgi:hypothetical protein